MGLSRQEYWSGLPSPSPGDLPNPGIQPASLKSPALAGGFFTTNATWEAPQVDLLRSTQCTVVGAATAGSIISTEVCTVNAHNCQRGFTHSGTAMCTELIPESSRQPRRNPISFHEEKGKWENVDSMAVIAQRRPVSCTTASPFGHTRYLPFGPFFFSFWLCHAACGILVPQPGFQ